MIAVQSSSSAPRCAFGSFFRKGFTCIEIVRPAFRLMNTCQEEAALKEKKKAAPLRLGVFFSNRKISTDEPSIMDLGPTILKLLEVPLPKDLDGRPLM